MTPRHRIALLTAGVASSLLLASPQEASATTAFARQTGMSCTACHFQRYPMLNAFGREFKAKGYTLMGAQPTVKDKGLSLPGTLNAGLVSKFRYQKKNGTSKTGTAGMLNEGEFQVPDEAFVTIGGRVAENIGFQAELNLVDVSGSGIFAAFKMPFVFYPSKGFIANVIPFTTDTQGPAYGFELLNTGAVRFSRTFENRTETSAQQYLGTATKSTGAALVLYNKLGYINYTPYVVRSSEADPLFSAGRMLTYVRGAVTPTVGKWDLAAGFQLWQGDSRYTTLNASSAAVETVESGDAWAVDAQAQGNIGTLPLGVYATYGSASKSTVTEPNIYNTSTADDKAALTLAAELGVIPYKLTVGGAYRNASNGKSTLNGEDAWTLGVNYLVAKNVTLQLNHTIYSYDADLTSGGDNLTTVMVYSSF